MTSRRDLLSAASARLRAAGVGSPTVDSELLLAHTLGVARGRLLGIDDVDTEVAAAFEVALARRERREPLQHIVGSAPFRHLDLAVGPGVFIPRPESELLVDAVLPVLNRRRSAVVVDLCAGSGALALAIRDECPAADVWAVEFAAGALAWLRRNATGTGVQVVDADIRHATLLEHLAGRVDVVVSNPPYLPTSARLEPEVCADPPEALFAGRDGLDLVPAVIARARVLLREGGMLALEHDDSHAEAVPELLRRDGRWTGIEDRSDLAGRPRFTIAIRR